MKQKLNNYKYGFDLCRLYISGKGFKVFLLILFLFGFWGYLGSKTPSLTIVLSMSLLSLYPGSLPYLRFYAFFGTSGSIYRIETEIFPDLVQLITSVLWSFLLLSGLIFHRYLMLNVALIAIPIFSVLGCVLILASLKSHLLYFFFIWGLCSLNILFSSMELYSFFHGPVIYYAVSGFMLCLLTKPCLRAIVILFYKKENKNTQKYLTAVYKKSIKLAQKQSKKG